MKTKCVVIAQRPVGRDMLRYVPQGAFLIAADGGVQQARELGLAADLAVGDFDSLKSVPKAREIVRLPAEKDDTDLMFSVKEALERGYRDIVILGALGGRMDHSLAAFAALLYLTKRGARGLVAAPDCEVRCVAPNAPLSLPVPPQQASGRKLYLSVLPAGGVALGVCLAGVKYPLDNASLLPEMPLGVSNEFAGPKALISCRQGYLHVLTVWEDR